MDGEHRDVAEGGGGEHGAEVDAAGDDARALGDEPGADGLGFQEGGEAVGPQALAEGGEVALGGLVEVDAEEPAGDELVAGRADEVVRREASEGGEEAQGGEGAEGGHVRLRVHVIR